MFNNPIAHLPAGTRFSPKEIELIKSGALSRMTPHPTVTIKPQEKGPILKTGKSNRNTYKRIRWSNGKNNDVIKNGSARVREYDPKNSPNQVATKIIIPQ